MLSKRSQITVLLILILVLVIGTFLVFYISRTITERGVQVVTEEEILPEEFKPVKLFVENCVKKTTIDGFKLIGQHGGYIDPTKIPNVKSESDTTNSDLLQVSQELNIPYWFYLRTHNLCTDCSMHSLMPSLENIKKQMDTYIKENLPICIDDFEEFKKQGFTITDGQISPDVSINDKDVSVFISYPLDIEKQEVKKTATQFRAEIDLYFKDIYNLALDIASVQRNFQFLEESLLSNILFYSQSPDPRRIPPIYWIDHSFAPAKWIKSNVERQLKDILASNINFIQVDQTKNAEKITLPKEEGETPLAQGFYDSMYLEFLETPYPTMNVNFMYDPSWNIFMDITPNTEGRIIEPEVVKTNFLLNFAPPKQTNYYEFFYDVSFPTLVMIRDDQSLLKNQETGYTFMFALEANIRDNKNLLLWNQGEGTLGPIDYTGAVQFDVSTTETETIECIMNNSQWACPTTGDTYEDELKCSSRCINQTTITETRDPSDYENLFCNRNQRISGIVSIEITDEKSKKPIPGASVTFGCGNYATCALDSTSIAGTLKTKLPVCFGSGHLTVDKPGYASYVVRNITTKPDIPNNIKVSLKPLVDKQISFVSIDTQKLLTVYPNPNDEPEDRILKIEDFLEPLPPKYEVIMALTRTDVPPQEGTLPIPLINIEADKIATVPMADGIYEINIILQDTEGVNISTDPIELPDLEENPYFDSTGIDFSAFEPMEVQFKPAVIGGTYFNSETGLWNISDKDLRARKGLQFIVMKTPDPEFMSDLNEIDQLENLSKIYRQYLEPQHINFKRTS